MKFLNDFKNVFAIVGVVSIIFWTCASDSVSNESNDDSSLPPQLTGGTYQVESEGSSWNSNNGYIVVLNTQTGVMKTYERDSSIWTEVTSVTGLDTTITFTH